MDNAHYLVLIHIFQKFYLEYRLAVGYAKEDAASLWPTFKSLEEWEPLKSTKMDVCAKICAHYLKHDDVGDITFEEGEAVFPDVPDLLETEVRRTRRIIIYAEFPSMAPLLQNVRIPHLNLLTINTLTSGSTTLPCQEFGYQWQHFFRPTRQACEGPL